MMGIYIKNMEKPENCGECFFETLDAEYKYGEWATFRHCLAKHIETDGCPLEEEPTGILAHDIRKVASLVKPYMIVAQTYDEQIERAKAVKDWLMGIVGERRNNE